MFNPFSTRSEMGIRKRVLSLLLVVLVPLLLLQAFTFYNWYRHAEEEELQANLELARTAAKTFEAFVSDVVSTQRALGLAATASPPLADASLLAIMEEAEKKYPMLRSFTWIGSDGVPLVTTNPEIAHQTAENREKFSRAASSGSWTVSPVYVSPRAKDRVFTISCPIPDPKGGVLGVVVCTVAADKLDSLLAVQRAKGAGVSLIDNKGIHVYRHPPTSYTPEQMNWLERFPALREALQGKETPFKVVGTGGETRLGAFVPIPSVGWAAAASRAESDVTAAITRTLLPQAIIALTVTVLALGAAVLLYRPLIASIFKLKDHAAALGRREWRRMPLEECPAELQSLADTLNEMEEKIRLREAELRESGERWATTLASIGDAVISADVSGRVTFMNKVAEELTGWAGSDALTKPVDAVFNIVDEKTRQKVEDPVAKILKEGMVAGLANHTILLRKDGTEIPIDDSGAPIRDKDGKVLGAVLIFRDITERKKTEEALRKSEAKANALIRYAPTGIYEIDYRGPSFISINDAICQTLGYTREEMFRIGPVAFLDEAGRARFADRIRRKLAGEKIDETVEFRIRKKDGGVIDAVLNVSLNFGGEPGRALVIAHDITERRRAEESLRRSETMLAWAEKIADVGSWEWDIRSGQLIWSSQTYRIFGVEAGKFVPTRSAFLSRVLPEDRLRTKRVMAAALANRKPYDLEFRILRPDSSVRWLHSRGEVICDEGGSASRVFGAAADITERKQAEEALRESQALLRAVMENVSDSVYVKDRQSRILMCNPALEKVVGKPAAAIIGKTDGEYYEDPAGGRVLRENDLRVMESGRAQTVEETARTPEGLRTFLSSKAPYRNEAGEIIGTLGISHDITARKRMEEELLRSRAELELRVQERTEELEKSRERLRQLASQLLLAQEKERKRVAVDLHDGLLSELAAMKMLFEAKVKLLEQGNLSDFGEFKKVSDILALVTKEVRGIMNNLHPSVLDELGLIAAINWLSGEYEKAYPHIKVRMRIEILEPDIPESIRVVIYRVLQEALNNFAKHGKGDSVEMSLAKTDPSFALVIRDNGQGFDMEKAQKGLGLESMRERVELSGGRFQIESAVGRGTALRAVWPLE